MDYLGDVLRLLGILAALALVFFLAWFITRAVATNGSFNGKGKYFTILERFPVSKDSYIMLIKCFDKILLVGVTPGGMNVLEELDEDSVDLSVFKNEKQSFSSVLKTTLNETIHDGKLKDTINKFTKHKNGGERK